MGLDLYAYFKEPPKPEGEESPEEVFYWRSHYRLQRWLRNLEESRRGELFEPPPERDFICAADPDTGERLCSPPTRMDGFMEWLYENSMELTSSDIRNLIIDIIMDKMPYDKYDEKLPYEFEFKERDLTFCKTAMFALWRGQKVWINGSW